MSRVVHEKHIDDWLYFAGYLNIKFKSISKKLITFCKHFIQLNINDISKNISGKDIDVSLSLHINRISGVDESKEVNVFNKYSSKNYSQVHHIHSNPLARIIFFRK